MTVVEELVSVLGLEIGSDVMSTLAKFQATVSEGIAGLATLGGVAAAAFAGIVVSVAHVGDEVGNMAEQLGVSTDALQELRYAADQSDVSFDTLTGSMKFLSKNAYEAATGSKEAMEAFAGIPLRNANGQLKTADQLLFATADRFRELKDPIKQTNLAMKVFGRGGMAMLPMMKASQEELEGFIDDAHELGYVLDKETIAASDRFDKSWKRLRSSLEGVRNRLGAPFVDGFGKALNGLANIIRDKVLPFASRLAVALQDAGKRIGYVMDVLVSIGQAIMNIGSRLMDNPIMRAIGELVGSVNGMYLLEAAVIGLSAVLVTTGLAAAASWLLAVAPFVLLAVLIGLIVDDIRAFIDGQDSVIGRVQKWAKAFDPNDSPVIRFFKTALDLLFDLTDPAKWSKFATAAVEAVAHIGRAIKSYIADSAVGKFLSSAMDFMNDPLGPERRAAIKQGLGNAVDPFGAMGLGTPPQMAQGNFRPGFVGGASSPDASASIAPRAEQRGITQTNHFQVDASGMTPEQAKKVVKDAVDDANREAHAAVGGGH